MKNAGFVDLYYYIFGGFIGAMYKIKMYFCPQVYEEDCRVRHKNGQRRSEVRYTALRIDSFSSHLF